jgi:hypothetical protein
MVKPMQKSISAFGRSSEPNLQYCTGSATIEIDEKKRKPAKQKSSLLRVPVLKRDMFTLYEKHNVEGTSDRSDSIPISNEEKN